MEYNKIIYPKKIRKMEISTMKRKMTNNKSSNKLMLFKWLE
jgi:hypothetical protein